MNLMRDQKTKALINTDVAALNKYKAERQQARDVKRLSAELSEVKRTLAEVCERIEKIEKV